MVAFAGALGSAGARAEAPQAGRTMADVLAAAAPADWRPLDPENTLYVELEAGRVVIELAPRFAPQHAANIRQLARQGYYDGLAIIRSHDNFVVQWGDPDGQRDLGKARAALPAEFTVAIGPDLPFTLLPDRDGYAPEVGFSGGFPAARDPRTGQAWLEHCYAMVGAGRGNDVESGSGAELYVVTGHGPRQLDRSIALVGRTAGDPMLVTGTVRAAIREVDPNQPLVNVRTMEGALSNTVAQPRLQMVLLTLFALVAAALAVVGVYGVMAYTVSQRTQEIGVRVAMGASPGTVARLVVGQGLRLALAGVALGLVAAFAAARAIEGLLFNVSGMDPITFVVAPAVLSAAAVLASYIPARKAARISPVTALGR